MSTIDGVKVVSPVGQHLLQAPRDQPPAGQIPLDALEKGIILIE